MIQLSAVTRETPAMSGSDRRTHSRSPAVVPVENHAVARARAPGKDRVQQKWAKKRAGHGADGQRRDADALHQQQRRRRWCPGRRSSGATACTLNCLRTSSTAPKTPPAKKHNCAGSRMRVRLTQSAAFCASKPSNHQWTYQGAAISASDDSPTQHQVHGGQNDRKRTLTLLFAGPSRDSE